MWVRAACRESVANWMRLNESVQRGAAFHFHSEWICTQPEAVQQEMRRGERDKRLAMCVCVCVVGERLDCARTTEFLCSSMKHLYLVFVYGCICVCVTFHFPPLATLKPFIETALLIAHPNSLQPVAHEKATEQNQISKQHCITAARHHTEF